MHSVDAKLCGGPLDGEFYTLPEAMRWVDFPVQSKFDYSLKSKFDYSLKPSTKPIKIMKLKVLTYRRRGATLMYDYQP